MADTIKRAKAYWKTLGPGLITGASDDDPSGIATYSVAGAQAGYGLLWTSLWLLPLMASVQETCARIGMVAGTGLVGVVKARYGRRLLVVMAVLLLMANTLNIGADLSAMAESVRLLTPSVPAWIISLAFTVIIVTTMIRFSYLQIVGVLKWLTFALLAYIAAAFAAGQDWPRLLIAVFVPHLTWDRETIIIFVGVMGTTISPYLFFWQASEEVEERHARGAGEVTRQDIKEMRRDVYLGMSFSNLVMFFIMATTASAFFARGIHGMDTVAEVASALRPIAGEWAFLLFALGAVGTGFLAIPVLAGSVGYVMAEAFGWKEGLAEKFGAARNFYAAIAATTFIGFILTLIGWSPVAMLVWTAVVYGIISPPLIAIILKIANDPTVMGPHVNGLWSNVLGWMTFALMTAGALALAWFTFF